jgi:1-acyl-sn-glycerol-3-phosphate acyltransferase
VSCRHLARSVLKRVGWAVAHSCFTIRVEGCENIPPSGPLIVICNHFHWSEPLLLGISLPWEAEFIGSAAAMRLMGVGWFLRMYGGIPVERGGFNRSALTTALGFLRQGRIVGIFPEGRTHKTALGESFPGMAFLAKHSGAPVLPVAVEGTDDAEGALRLFHRLPAVVRFGEVFRPHFAPEGGAHARDRLRAANDEMMARIAALLPVHNRGRYAQ